MSPTDDSRFQFVPPDQKPPMSPQLAVRATILGTLALALFAIIFFRLWFLQVLSSGKYVAEASVNVTRELPILPQRGEIVDRNGNVLVDSVKGLAVQIAPPDLPVRLNPQTSLAPPAADVVIFNRLARLLHMSRRARACGVVVYGPNDTHSTVHVRLPPIACAVAQEQNNLPYADVTIKSGVSQDLYFYVAERQDQFPGVNVAQVYVRHYPDGNLAAQLFGTVGPINPGEVHEARYHGLSEDSIIGQDGLEYEYDEYLRGTVGQQRIEVNSNNQYVGTLPPTPPVAGQNLRLSLDANLQRAGQAALQQSIDDNPPANGGAFVALNPVNGQVYAMGSNPTFNPTIFTKAISQKQYNALTSPASNYPLINRAIQSVGPTGSTFKPITATAALESGAWLVDETYDDTGKFCTTDGVCRQNAGGGANGVLNLVNAIRVSDDVFFYNLGALTNAPDPVAHPNGGALQQWASAFGIGHKTGIDLPFEVSGTLPTPGWRATRNQLEAECDTATGPFRYTNGQVTSAVMHKGWRRSPRHAPGGCGIADGTDRPWSVGDNINLAVGQGDVQVSPLQLAVVYSAIANGGTVVTPHLGLDIEQPDGTVLQEFNPPPARHLNINPTYLATIQAGLRAAASQPGGTSDDVMGNFPEQVYGKTGTAQYNGQQDYSWYACFVPPTATSKPIMIVVWVEQGGFGDVAAAPVAREMLSQWFFGNPGTYVRGTSNTF